MTFPFIHHRRFFLLISAATLLWSSLTYAQDATQGLFICDNGSGVKNIVTAAQKSAQKGRCQPYKKGMLGGGSGSLMTVPSKTANPTPPPSSRKPIQLSIPKTNNLPAQSLPPAKPQKTDDAPIQIYFCPDNLNGEIIEATTPPRPECQSVGIKAKIQDPRTTPINTGKPLGRGKADRLTKSTPNGKGEVGLTDSPPTDIYKCYDQQGRPSYVAENKTKNFRRCSFFSRSFAGATADFYQKSTTPTAASLTDLAAQGVNQNNKMPTASAALKCVGAGEVVYNGTTKEYQCATRSYDLTPGTSGGQVVLGNKSANIAAHRFDYFNTGGSCGGIVTSSEGRILHLSPTKDCPEAFQIEARKIEQAYIKTISINVSGALLERQRTLSPQINEIAYRIGIDPFLVHAIISAESAYKSRAVSRVGAQGLMQLMPATAKRFGVRDTFHTGENIRGGATYLKWLLNKFNGNYQLAIAGYNAGEGNVIKYGYKIPPFIETRAYVPKVMEYYRRYKANPSLVGLK
ncbi:lytic transglycosylase domain-containing protein [Suttonella ornithocola]|uniref:Soluble lytic murein transglycosylase n=1 Tax=Suttonella ornithocola TaxID=279832 RepID=A0A380MMG3_9GAMM|nr:lytic transglycosylase domain-containing protein [Suttonella ornithocola]SUO93819.1 Soluble lytic murein transglycosylase precursor [Suttonella ornithocola]